MRDREAHPPGHFNRSIERKVSELGGIKSLYSESYFPRGRVLGDLRRRRPTRALKARYDPHGRLPDLYEKCVLRH